VRRLTNSVAGNWTCNWARGLAHAEPAPAIPRVEPLCVGTQTPDHHTARQARAASSAPAVSTFKSAADSSRFGAAVTESAAD
jgi:hypothetical protein